MRQDTDKPFGVQIPGRCGGACQVLLSTLAAKNPERVEIRYELAAKPSFDVPEFLLKRLLKRDAQQMIGRLQDEMTRPR
jgi:hypothetical protein